MFTLNRSARRSLGRTDLIGRTAALMVLAGCGVPAAPAFAQDSRFAVIGLPDTQNYSQFYPDIFRRQVEWIIDSQQQLNTAFVTHYGDVVNNGDRPNEWANARAAMDLLDGTDIPYGVVAGNHDITPSGVAGSPYIPQPYRDNFGPQRFTDRSWYGGASPNGMSNYQVFSAGGREFRALHLQCDTPLNDLVWAQGVLNRHKNTPVMVTTHRYLQDAEDYTAGVPVVPSGRYPDIWYGVEGVYAEGGIRSNEFHDWFVRRNTNIFMVNCGHFHEEYRQTTTNVDGRVVHEVLADYQDDPNGGDGWLRIMSFDTARNTIDVESYSPTRNEFRSAAESRFTLNVNFDQYAKANTTVVFHQGVNGYSGTKDTWINQASPNTSYGSAQTIHSDDDTNNSIFSDNRGQALLRFDGMFSALGEPVNGHEAIPLNATITKATLRLTIADDIDTPFANPRFFVYALTRPWDENSTWNSLVGGLTSPADLGLLLGSFLGDNNPDSDTFRAIDVTAAVQLWANGQANYGFAILPEIISGNDDGIEVYSAQAANVLFRPSLEVSYTYWGPVPTPGAAGVVLAGVVVLGGRRRRRSV